MRSLLSSCVLLAPLAAQSPDLPAPVTLNTPMLVPIHTAPADPVGAIYWSSYHRLGHEYGRLGLAGGPPTSIALAGFSLAPANAPLAPFGFGNCILLIDPLAPSWIGSSAVVTDAAGAASIGIPVQEQLAPFTCHFQWLMFTGASFATTQATAGLGVVFDR